MMNFKRILAALLVCVLLCFLPVLAEPQLDNITDSAGILSTASAAALNREARTAENSYDFGIYAIIVNDWHDYVQAGNIIEAAGYIYDGYELGTGNGHDGLLLLMSMRDREYAIITGSDFSNLIFNDKALDRVEEQFLDNFRVNDWEGGFRDYISAAGRELSNRHAGAAERWTKMQGHNPLYAGGRSPAINLLIILGIPLAIALTVCSGFAAQMKTARAAANAGGYIKENTLRFSARSDTFTHTTERRTKIESNSSRSGGGGGGGHRGHSGHF